MNLYEAVFLEKTIKSFRMEPLEQRLLNQILNFTNHLTMLSDTQQVRFEIADNIKNKAVVGPFAVRAPYYLVLTIEKSMDCLINSGYLMQQSALYLVTKGIASCFMELHRTFLGEWEEKECFVFMLPFGKTDRVLYRDIQKASRMGLDELCVFKEEVDANVMTMLQAARLAPSAMNNQPWHFVVYNNRIHIFLTRERLITKKYDQIRRIDIGMVLANLLIAAEEMWLDTEVVKREGLAELNLKKNEYICTVLIHK